MTDAVEHFRILVVDDNPINLDVLGEVLESAGYWIQAAADGPTALRLAREHAPDLVLLDLMMPQIDGLEVCRLLKAQETASPVIFISARDDIESLEAGFSAGAVDYITKPFQADEVLLRVRTHLQIHQLTRRLEEKNSQLQETNTRLEEEIQRRHQTEDALAVADAQLAGFHASRGTASFVGQSRTLRASLEEIRRLQNFSGVNVLIQGESGTGKELVARALHEGSARASGAFLALNCVAIPGELAESTLFGHMKGAFTGAIADRKGYFELADRGTLFLDEIGDMPGSLQAKLLRVLEDGLVTPVGATQARKVSVRVVSATHVDLPKAIAEGRFRQDLYYRLAQYTLRVPPLRDRLEDIGLLAEHFLAHFAREMGMRPPVLTSDAVAALRRYHYPGNIRELRNIIERALIDSGGQEIQRDHIALPGRAAPSASVGSAFPAAAGTPETAPSEPLPTNLEDAEDFLIQKALADCGGNVSQAARRLGINRTRIYRRLAGKTDELSAREE